MVHPRSLLPALAAATLGLGIAAPLAAPAAATTQPAPAAATTQSASAPALAGQAGEELPLTMTIDSLAPASLPESGPVTLTGTVANTTDDTWVDVDIYPFAGTAPITTTAELDEALKLDPAIPVGDRIIEGTYSDTVGDLEPGDQASWEITIPRRLLVSDPSPGVYWLGAHALGGPAGRDTVADGKARTFLPYLAPEDSIDLAMVLPLRHGPSKTPQGRIVRPEQLQTSLSPGGRLYSVADFGAQAGDSLTWLVDPAVPDAAGQLADGNPRRDLGPTGTDQDDDETEEPSQDPSTEESTEDLFTDRGTGRAGRWLDLAGDAVAGDELLALPWGDLDVSAASTRAPDTYVRARKRSAGPLRPWELEATPVVSPPGGFLSTSGLDLLPPDTVALITDQMLGDRGSTPALIEVDGRRIGVITSDVGAGGPGPDNPTAPVAIRQRMLSEAALRAIDGQPAMIAVLPDQWPQGSGTDFFGGVEDVDWLRLRTVTDLYADRAEPVAPEELTYPTAQQRAELTSDVFSAIDDMIQAGATVDELLPEADHVEQATTQDALLSGSYFNRHDPGLAADRARRGAAGLESQLSRITVTGPRSATLASDTGKVSATVTNGTDYPIEIRVIGQSDPSVEITPSPRVRLDPGERTTQLLDARAGELGVHEVVLQVVTTEGTQIGATDTVPMRSGQVSDVIWVILAVGLGLLFGAVVVRGIRRALASRRAQHDGGGPDPAPDPAPYRGPDEGRQDEHRGEPEDEPQEGDQQQTSRRGTPS